MKKMRYMKIIVMLFGLLISCSAKNIFASDTNDIVEEKIDVSENIIEASWNALVDSIEYGLIRMGK